MALIGSIMDTNGYRVSVAAMPLYRPPCPCAPCRRWQHFPSPRSTVKDGGDWITEPCVTDERFALRVHADQEHVVYPRWNDESGAAWSEHQRDRPYSVMRPKHQNGRFGGSSGSGRAKTEDLPWVSGPFDVVSAVAPLFLFSFVRFTLFLLFCTQSLDEGEIEQTSSYRVVVTETCFSGMGQAFFK